MDRSQLTKEQVALLNTDFGPLEKVAADQVKIASEMYNYGANMADKVIAQIKEMTKVAQEEEEEEEELDEDEEKTAAECAAFIERGFVEKLAAAGLKDHNNELYYFGPYIEEKIAEAAVKVAAGKWNALVAGAKNLAAKAKASGAAAGAKVKGVAGKAKASGTATAAKAKDAGKSYGKDMQRGGADLKTLVTGKGGTRRDAAKALWDNKATRYTGLGLGAAGVGGALAASKKD